jgi:hypothetical protein
MTALLPRIVPIVTQMEGAFTFSAQGVLRTRTVEDSGALVLP